MVRGTRCCGDGLEPASGFEGVLDGVEVAAEKNHRCVFTVSRSSSGRDNTGFNGVEDAASGATNFSGKLGGGYEFRFVHTPVESVKFDRCSMFARPSLLGGLSAPLALALTKIRVARRHRRRGPRFVFGRSREIQACRQW